MTELGDPLSVEQRAADDEHLVLVLHGDLDPYTGPILESHISEALSDSARLLVLDVGGVTFIDSSGLRAIVAAYKRMLERGGRLVLRDPSPATTRLLEITGLSARISCE